jgi:hypothetical protein
LRDIPALPVRPRVFPVGGVSEHDLDGPSLTFGGYQDGVKEIFLRHGPVERKALIEETPANADVPVKPSVLVEPEEGDEIALQHLPERSPATGGDIARNPRGIGQRAPDSGASRNHELWGSAAAGPLGD